jgi:hypothetical protein
LSGELASTLLAASKLMRVSTLLNAERQALTTGANGMGYTGWNGNTGCHCDWPDVTCEAKRVNEM